VVWLVVGDDYLPIEPIDRFLDYLRDLERSPNTVRAYAYHLKLFWDYLEARDLDWRAIGLSELAGFVAWLRRGSSRVVPLEEQESQRSESTINAILSAVYAFREFHRRTGELPAGSSNSDESWSFPTTRPYKPFLHHISKSKLVRTRLVKLKQPRLLPRTLQPAQIQDLVRACHHLRDQLLVCLVYEAGLRIGQALGLRHQDVRSWDNQIAVVPRDNINGARTKRRDELVVDVDPAVMSVYARYLVDELGELDTDYVFVNLWDGEIGKPMTYGAVLDLFRRLEKRTGIYARPHMLRHSHATDLIRTGHWDLSYVQRRLGHVNIQTTAKYLHLVADDLKTAHQDYLRRRQERDGHGR
jgi:integrase